MSLLISSFSLFTNMANLGISKTISNLNMLINQGKDTLNQANELGEKAKATLNQANDLSKKIQEILPKLEDTHQKIDEAADNANSIFPKVEQTIGNINGTLLGSVIGGLIGSLVGGRAIMPMAFMGALSGIIFNDYKKFEPDKKNNKSNIEQYLKHRWETLTQGNKDNKV